MFPTRTNISPFSLNSVIGSPFVFICSLGQSTREAHPLFSLVSLVGISFMTFVPAFVKIQLVHSHDGTSAMVDTTRQNDKVAAEVMIWFMFACGVVLSLLTFQTILDTAIPQDYKDKHPLLKNVLASETVRMERSIKRAAAYKMNHLVRRAVKVHQAAEFEHGSGKDTSFGRALLAYGKTSNDQEEVGGFLYMYKRVWNGKLFDEDGIWLSNRMIQGMIAQFVICLWLVPFLQLIYGYITDFYGNIYADIAPPRWRILVPIIAGFTLGEFNAVKLMTSYIPSSAKTVLEFRTGALGSLHDAGRCEIAFFMLRRHFTNCYFFQSSPSIEKALTTPRSFSAQCSGKIGIYGETGQACKLSTPEQGFIYFVWSGARSLGFNSWYILLRRIRVCRRPASGNE